MKFLILVIMFLVTGCAQLMNGELQPVKLKDPNKGTYSTTCAGAVENWATCNEKAMRTCHQGYFVLDKVEDGTGTKRELTFQCKK